MIGALGRRVGAAALAACRLGLSGTGILLTWNLHPLSTSLMLHAGRGAGSGLTGLIAVTGLRSLLQLQSTTAAQSRTASTALALTAAAQAAGTLLAGPAGTGPALTVALQVHGALHFLAAVLCVPSHQQAWAPRDPEHRQ